MLRDRVPTEKDEPPEAPDISLQKHDRALPDHDRRCGNQLRCGTRNITRIGFPNQTFNNELVVRHFRDSQVL